MKKALNEPVLIPTSEREIIPYDKHKTLELIPRLNRDIDPKHIRKLMDSVKTMGVVRDVIVVRTTFFGGKWKSVIIDGQNLFCALVQLEMDIPIRYVQVTTIEDLITKMALLNSSSKAWTFKNYVHAFSSINPNYKALELYKQAFLHLEYPIILAAASGSNTSGRYANVKKGKFELGSLQETERKLKHLNDFFHIIGRGGHIGAKKYFTNEYLTFLAKEGDEYSHTKFKTFLASNLDKIVYSNLPPAGKLVKFFSKYK